MVTDTDARDGQSDLHADDCFRGFDCKAQFYGEDDRERQELHTKGHGHKAHPKVFNS